MITFKSSHLKPLNQLKPNLAGMVPFKNCVCELTLYSRGPLLKIERKKKLSIAAFLAQI
jgi:hypothetical protein